MDRAPCVSWTFGLRCPGWPQRRNVAVAQCWHVAPALDWGFPEEQWLGLQGEVILSGD